MLGSNTGDRVPVAHFEGFGEKWMSKEIWRLDVYGEGEVEEEVDRVRLVVRKAYWADEFIWMMTQKLLEPSSAGDYPSPIRD